MRPADAQFTVENIKSCVWSGHVAAQLARQLWKREFDAQLDLWNPVTTITAAPVCNSDRAKERPVSFKEAIYFPC